MRLLVTGGDGAVASYAHEVFEPHGWIVETPGRHILDVTLPREIDGAMREWKPDAVLHLAAATDVDWCERNVDEAFHINSTGTENVARACFKHRAKLAYVSTAGVFGHDSDPHDFYVEGSPPEPANAYGRSKLEGERNAQTMLVGNALVVRSGWMFGGGDLDKKFVGMILRQIAAGNTQLRAVSDVAGSPTYARDLLDLIRQLIEARATWLYHGANGGAAASRYDVATAILDVVDHDRLFSLQPVTSDYFPADAPRANSEVIFSRRLPARLVPREWQNALEEYLRSSC